MRLALYQPDIPQNAGTLIRLAACLGIGIDIIEPCGFLLSDSGFRRAGMDYLARADIARHLNWDAFRAGARGRIVLLTVHAALPYTKFRFVQTDILLLGRESAGVPECVHAAVDGRLRVPMRQGPRSLNVATAGAMVLGEGLRQTAGFAA
jgi:tRNA (cytidine/uridine-2'-O-)-methyltransferase